MDGLIIKGIKNNAFYHDISGSHSHFWLGRQSGQNVFYFVMIINLKIPFTWVQNWSTLGDIDIQVLWYQSGGRYTNTLDWLTVSLIWLESGCHRIFCFIGANSCQRIYKTCPGSLEKRLPPTQIKISIIHLGQKSGLVPIPNWNFVIGQTKTDKDAIPTLYSHIPSYWSKRPTHSHGW